MTKISKNRWQKLAGILKESENSSSDNIKTKTMEENIEPKDYKILGLSVPGVYWFENFDTPGKWEIIYWDGKRYVQFIGTDEDAFLYKGNKEEYISLSMTPNQKLWNSIGILGNFVGPLTPPNS